MSCNVEFDRSGLFDRLGSKFISTTFRDIRQDQLYEIEKGYFPATQNVIEERLKIRELSDERDSLVVKYDRIRKEHINALVEYRHSTEKENIRDVIDHYEMIKSNIEIIDEQLHEEQDAITRKIDQLRNGNITPTQHTYIMQCGWTDCKGLLSNENTTKEGNFKCSICHAITCRECHAFIKNDKEHTCDPDTLKSIRLLETTSKPCPSCKTFIQKISGCDQMFCTHCNASFNWRTLRLNNGAVHNPHHAEWLRNRNVQREVGDIPCGRELDIDLAIGCNRIFNNLIKQNNHRNSAEYKNLLTKSKYLFEAMRMAIHHHFTTIANLNRNRYGQHTNQSLRIDLLLNHIDEDMFKRDIQKRDKANSKRLELLQIVLTYRDAITDIVWPFIEFGPSKTLKEWIALTDEVKALENYIDGCFQKMSKVYNIVQHNIMDDRYIR